MRLSSIDILRGFAVLFVVVYHFYSILDLKSSIFYSVSSIYGSLGVPLFFVISGYLIFGSIANNIQKRGIKKGMLNYFLHRIFRIVPAYYVSLFVVFILAYYFMDMLTAWSNKFILKYLFSELTFTSYFNYKVTGFGLNGAYWTLNIEMLWYLLAPLFVLLFKKNMHLLILFCIGLLYFSLIDLGFFDKIFNLDKHQSNYLPLLYFYSYQLPGQIIYFIAGIYIYKKTQEGLEKKDNSKVKLLFGTLIILIAYLLLKKFIIESFLLRNILQLTVVVLLFKLWYLQQVVGLTLLKWIGEISYSLYLWHMPLLYLIKKYLLIHHISSYLMWGIYLASLFLIASLSYYFVEQKGYFLRDRFIQLLRLKNKF